MSLAQLLYPRTHDPDPSNLVLAFLIPTRHGFRFVNPKLLRSAPTRVASPGDLMPATEHLLVFQATVLEMIATGRQLVPILDAIAHFVEAECGDVRCSVSFIDPELRIRTASSPNLSPKYRMVMDGVPIHHYIGPCGLAAYQKQQIISENIETDKRWSAEFRTLGRELGLKACCSTPIRDSHGNVIATFALYAPKPGAPTPRHLKFIDLATRLAGIAIERQLREDRLHLYADIIARSAEAIRILDLNGNIIEQNAAHRLLFNIPDEHLLGKSSAVIFGDEQLRDISESIQDGRTFSAELAVIGPGHSRIIDVSVFPVHEESGTVVCYVSLNRDVTESRRNQDELQRSHDELEARVESRTSQLRQLSARILSAQDQERRRIARDLHDSVGQYLAAIQMNLGALRNSVTLSQQHKTRIIDSIELVELSLSEIRTISYLLHPPLLDETGLRSALLSYIEGFSKRSGIQVNVDIPDDLPRLSPDIETTIFRVIQQSLGNIHRHSGSRVAQICIKEFPNSITVQIHDRGRGISPKLMSEFWSGNQLAGVGIAGMRERIRDMRGQFDIRSGTEGTTVEITVPIQPQQSKAAHNST
jgi:PAS domain S-box-containing protein